MSTAGLDLFELLDIPRREDSYSSLLRQLLHDSPKLRQRLLAHAFTEAPALVDATVLLRTSLPDGAGVPDLLVAGHDAHKQRWELFVENKIDAGEPAGQTQGYLDACRRRAGDRAAGVFLTLDGRPAGVQSGVTPLSHRELGQWVEACLPDLSDSVLRMAAEAYVRRVCAPAPHARPDDTVGQLISTAPGLQPLRAGVDALGRAIAKAAPSGWVHTAIRIQGPGHSNPGLLFHRPGWVGREISGNQFTRDNYNIHAELELAWEGTRCLKLHFETEPYMTKSWLQQLEGLDEFKAMRQAFRSAVHERADQLPGWKMTNYHLQVCIFELEVSTESRVSDVVAGLAEALVMLGPVADAALLAAKSVTPK